MISIVCITTPDDFAAPNRWRAMLSSLPHSPDVEVVTLINTIGTETAPALRLDYCDEHSGIHVRIYEMTYPDVHLGHMRTIATSLASHDWCMWMDSDDRIIYGDIIDVVRNSPPSVGAYVCAVTGMQSIDGNAAHYHAEQLRIWRRSTGAEWIGRIHEVIDTETIRANYRIAYADVVIHHSGYITTRDAQRKRLERNVRGLCATLIDVWDRDDLRRHYVQVMQRDISALNDMYHYTPN